MKEVYVETGIEVLFDENYVKRFQPIIYDKNGHGVNPEPEGIYYRILRRAKETAIQFFVYWEKQICYGIPFLSHRYDYEPLIVFLQEDRLSKVIIAGETDISKGGHKTEVYQDDEAYIWGKAKYKTNKTPQYPYGEHSEQAWFIAAPLTRMEFEGTRPKIGIATCYHVYSVEKKELTGPILDLPLKRLTEKTLKKWYEKEHFGHDVSNPWKFPHIRFHSPPKLKQMIEERLTEIE